MKLTDGREFEILNFGQYNPVESGPDFSNAKIKINDIIWFGNVEIHIKSSDWYKHNHHKDPAYDNVILHVVFDSDRIVMQNGMTIPELRLADFIDLKHFSKFEQHYRHSKNWNCSGMLHLVPAELFDDQIDKFLIQRFKRKSVDLSKYFNSFENRSAFLFLLARSFGMKANQLPFEMLARLLEKIDFSDYAESDHLSLILFASGLYFPEGTNDKILYQIFIRQIDFLPSSIWKKGGLRPSNQPEKRIKVFAKLYCDIIQLEENDWNKLIENNMFKTFLINRGYSEIFLSHLLVNTVSYFYFWLFEETKNFKYHQYFTLTIGGQAPESNRITKMWRSPKNYLINARYSQAFLEIYSELCSKKLCLNCNIGKYLIKDENHSENNILF
jgi:hypothetical protein